jgi:hypothetical protein
MDSTAPYSMEKEPQRQGGKAEEDGKERNKRKRGKKNKETKGPG